MSYDDYLWNKKSSHKGTEDFSDTGYGILCPDGIVRVSTEEYYENES